MNKYPYLLSKKERIKIIFVISILFQLLKAINYDMIKRMNLFLKNEKPLKISFFNELMIDNDNIKNNSILIFEPNEFHFECTPGYVKYFTELGFNVDILIHHSGIDSLFLFKTTENIRLFIFEKVESLNKYSTNLSSVIKQYYLIILQTADINKGNLFSKLGLLSINNSIFVFHNLDFIEKMNYSKYLEQNRIWTLGNFSQGLQVNPNYFGHIDVKEKNPITRFFLTSTYDRDYTNLINSAINLKNENFNFEIFVVGWLKKFNINQIPEKIYNNFIFKYGISYRELYQKIVNSDYIIIPLDPNRKNDIKYKTTKVTGSIQLSYGFLKPSIINQNFADIYNLNDKNSLIFNDSYNLYNAMKDAIILNNYN